MMKRYRIIPLLVILGLVNWAILELFPRYRYDAIVLHHSASWHGNYGTIRDFHRARFPGVRDAAYHLILSNGSAGIPLGHLEATERYRNLSYALATKNRLFNVRAVHVCVIGNYDQRPVPAELRPAIGHALNSLAQKYGVPRERILFHRDVGSSVCPGRHITKEDVHAWMDQAAAGCPADIQTQQAAVVQQVGLSPWTVPPLLLIGMALFTLLFSVAWLIFMLVLSTMRQPKEPDQAQEFLA
jgi:hypothetical protein